MFSLSLMCVCVVARDRFGDRQLLSRWASLSALSPFGIKLPFLSLRGLVNHSCYSSPHHLCSFYVGAVACRHGLAGTYELVKTPGAGAELSSHFRHLATPKGSLWHGRCVISSIDCNVFLDAHVHGGITPPPRPNQLGGGWQTQHRSEFLAF